MWEGHGLGDVLGWEAHGIRLVHIVEYVYIVLSFAPSAAAVWHCDHVRIPCESNSVRHSVFS